MQRLCTSSRGATSALTKQSRPGMGCLFIGLAVLALFFVVIIALALLGS